jgi:hypothetical protein
MNGATGTATAFNMDNTSIATNDNATNIPKKKNCFRSKDLIVYRCLTYISLSASMFKSKFIFLASLVFLLFNSYFMKFIISEGIILIAGDFFINVLKKKIIIQDLFCLFRAFRFMMF